MKKKRGLTHAKHHLQAVSREMTNGSTSHQQCEVCEQTWYVNTSVDRPKSPPLTFTDT